MMKESGVYFIHLPERSSKSLFRDGYGWWPTVLSGSLVYGYKLMRLTLPAQFSFKNLYADLKRVINIHMDMFCPSNCCRNISTVNDWTCQYPMQSAIQQSNIEQTDVQEQVVTSFDDQNPGEVVNIPSSIHVEEVTAGTNAEITHYLRRPVKIYTYNWTLGSTTTASFLPWHLYFNHTSIKKKVDNYFLLRCKLHLKFVINASPFHYGTMLMSYRPLDTIMDPAPISTSLSAIAQDVAYSQMPRVYLYPQTSQGGEIDLPFLYHKEWLDITSATDVSEMGTIFVRPLTPLQFANAGTGVPITIQVYAWADEVTLSGPTVKLAMQSFKDEYGAGVISGPASAVAHVSSLLKDVPIIGKFATATNMVAGAVGSVARFFGFTNVPVIADIHSFTPSPFPVFASPEIGTQIEKLTLDPKNELTIDPSSLGVDLGDELLIENIVKRESYLTQFPWAISNSPDDILFSIAICPHYLRSEAAGATSTLIQGTPLWLAQRPFDYWKGDIKIRFKFNCSMYHRGRVRVSWDPVGAIGATADSTTEVYTKIIDLAKCTDITINVPYMQEFAFCRRLLNYTQLFSNDGSQIHVNRYTNGVLTVRALTDLAAPLNTADVQVLVFVSGGDNLSFACPTEIDTSSALCAYPVQSAIEDYDVEHDETEMAISPSTISPSTYLLYQGEVVKSFRTLFRRTAFHRWLPAPTGLLTSTANLVTCSHIMPRVLTYPGYVTNAPGVAKGLITTGSTFPYNWVVWHPISWISQCFLGCRGSINWRVNLTSIKDVYSLQVSRTNNSGTLASGTFSSSLSSNATRFTDSVYVQRNSDETGTSLTNTKTCAGVNASVPFYSIFKFRKVSSVLNITGDAADESTYDWFETRYCVNAAADSNATSTYNNMGVEFYVGAGTDYSPIFFMNVPTLYAYASVPASA